MSKTIARLLASFALTATGWQRPMRQANTLLRLANHLHRRHTVDTPAGPLTFISTHAQALDYPAGLLTREPETIDWLNELDETSLLWDIGANVGAYSLYAARRGARVWAFEPGPASFAALSENIRVNDLDERITALPVALGKTTRIGWLHMGTTNPGSVAHTLGKQNAGDHTFRQAVVSYGVDAFRREFALPQPTHIKLDVDGIEADILEEAVETLHAPVLSSLLVEMDVAESPSNARIRDISAAAGLAIASEGQPDGHGHRNVIFARGC